MAIELIADHKKEVKEEPKKYAGGLYRITYQTLATEDLQVAEYTGFPVLFGPFLSISADQEGYMMPIFCIPTESVETVELVLE